MPKANGDGENIFYRFVLWTSQRFYNYLNRGGSCCVQCIFVAYTCSFDLGPAHIISFSTEVYYYLQYGFQQIINQRKWLEEDLKVKTHKRIS